jgi:hypothetical protein
MFPRKKRGNVLVFVSFCITPILLEVSVVLNFSSGKHPRNVKNTHFCRSFIFLKQKC